MKKVSVTLEKGNKGLNCFISSLNAWINTSVINERCGSYANTQGVHVTQFV